jgi:hypothetical protein
VQRFKSLGLEAFSRRVELPDRGVFHRVLIGTFATQGQARAVQHLQLTEHDLGESFITTCAKP